MTDLPSISSRPTNELRMGSVADVDGEAFALTTKIIVSVIPAGIFGYSQRSSTVVANGQLPSVGMLTTLCSDNSLRSTRTKKRFEVPGKAVRLARVSISVGSELWKSSATARAQRSFNPPLAPH